MLYINSFLYLQSGIFDFYPMRLYFLTYKYVSVIQHDTLNIINNCILFCLHFDSVVRHSDICINNEGVRDKLRIHVTEHGTKKVIGNERYEL